MCEGVDDAVADQAMTAVIANKTAAGSLPDAFKALELDSQRARSLLVALRNAGGNKAIEEAIREAGKLNDAVWKLTAELSQELVEQAKTTGNPPR